MNAINVLGRNVQKKNLESYKLKHQLAQSTINGIKFTRLT